MNIIKAPHMRHNMRFVSQEKRERVKRESRERAERSGRTVQRLHTEYVPKYESVIVSPQAVIKFHEEHGYWPSRLKIYWTPRVSYRAVSLYNYGIKRVVGVEIVSHSGEFCEFE